LSFLIGLVLAAVVVFAIARPLLRPRQEPRVPEAGEAATDADEALKMLAELEYDYRMEKIDEAEYRRQRDALERRVGQ
jgi:uncharacterized membrane protein